MKTTMKVLVCLMLILFGVSCEKKEQVADPKALYDFYFNNDEAREKKIAECRLLSSDDQKKSQECTIAYKAHEEKQAAKRGGAPLDPKGMDLK